MVMRDSARSLLRKLWMRLIVRHTDFSDNYSAFQTAYLMEDPYNLRSAAEAHRFSETNRIIRANFGRVNRLLEIGCAEGYQSR